MAKQVKRRSRLTYLGTMLCMALLLALLFFGGAFNIMIKGVSERVKEEVNLDVFLYNTASDADAKLIQSMVVARPYVKKVEYVSKDSAFALIQRELGGVDESMLDENPMQNSLNVHLTSNFFHEDSVKQFETWLIDEYPEQVEEVYYNPNQFSSINSNFNKLGNYLWIGSLLLLVVTVVLIFVTIRLAIYSERFTLNTMQLVGAKSSFIKRPFLVNSVLLGLGGGLMAIPIIIGVAYLMTEFNLDIQSIFSESNELTVQKSAGGSNISKFGLYFIILVAGGIAISLISTWFALRKYIRIKSENLY